MLFRPLWKHYHHFALLSYLLSFSQYIINWLSNVKSSDMAPQ